MTEPRTAAGRALAKPNPKAPPYNRMGFHTEWCGLWAMEDACSCGLADEVLAIEAEAAELAGGLDAAVLAEALNATVGTVGWLHFTPQSPVEEWIENAKTIAAEYDRLYRQSVVIPAGQDETPRTGEASS